MPWNKVTVIIEAFHPADSKSAEVGEQHRTMVEREFPNYEIHVHDVLDVVRQALRGADFEINGEIEVVPDDAEVTRVH